MAEEKKDFIEDYVEYAQRITDAPSFFHQAMAWFCISVAIDRRSFIDTGFLTYPNIWILLLAPSSKFRKSTSLNIASELIRGLGRECAATDNCEKPCTKAHSPIYPNDFSKEALFELIASRPRGAFLYSEMASLLSTLDRDYNLGTKALLTDLYDCPAEQERILRSQLFLIERPYINIASASTIDWFIQRATEDDFRGGFLSRFLYIVSDRKTVDRSPFETVPPDTSIKNGLREKLNRIRKRCDGGGVFVSENAKKEYYKYYKSQDSMDDFNPSIEPLLARYKTYTMKLMLIFCYNRYSDQDPNEIKYVQVEKEDVERAIVNIEDCAKRINKLFKVQFAFTRHQKNTRRIHELLDRQPDKKATRSWLMNYSHLDKNTFDRTVATMLESDMLVQTRDLLDGSKKPAVFYNLKEEK